MNISNQNVKQFEAQYREAVALLKEAQAQLFPTITASFNAQRGGGGGGTAAVSSAVGSGAGGSTHTEFTLEGLATWQPDIWGTIRRQIESRKAGVQVSEANLANAELSAQATLATDYFDLRAADSLRALLERAVTLDQRALEITRNQFQSGTATNGDVASAEASLEATQAQLVAVEQQRGTYEHAIAVLIGHLPSELSVAEAPLAAKVPQVPVSVPSELLERNPGIAAAERQMKQENALVGVAIGAYFPTISLQALGGICGQPAVHADQRRQPHLVHGRHGKRRPVPRRRAGCRGRAGACDVRSVRGQLPPDRARRPFSPWRISCSRCACSSARRSSSKGPSSMRRLAADVALNQFNAGTVSYTTVITDIQALIADQESLLTMRQNELVADVSLIESLGGGWNVSRL